MLKTLIFVGDHINSMQQIVEYRAEVMPKKQSLWNQSQHNESDGG